jgi:hypothetical protein
VAVFQDAVQQRGEAAGYAVMRREEGVGQAERGKERNYTPFRSARIDEQGLAWTHDAPLENHTITSSTNHKSSRVVHESKPLTVSRQVL